MDLPTFTEEYRTIDRSGWPAGAWDSEPDKAVWVDTATGLDAMVVRNRYGGLCGYAGVPAEHPLFGLDYTELPGNVGHVHGGITFAAGCHDDAEDHRGAVCHLSESGPVWWFGFDTSHAWDFNPGSPFGRFGDEVYRDLPYVIANVEHLAGELASA